MPKALVGVYLLTALSIAPPSCFAQTRDSSTEGQVVKKVKQRPQELIPLKHFPGDLLKGTRGLFSRKNLVPLLVGAGATGVSLGLDDSIKDWFDHVEYDSNGVQEVGRLDAVGGLGKHAGGGWIIGGAVGGLLLTSQFKGDERFRAMSYSAAQGFVLNGAITAGTKLAGAGRGRTGPTTSPSPPGTVLSPLPWPPSSVANRDIAAIGVVVVF